MNVRARIVTAATDERVPRAVTATGLSNIVREMRRFVLLLFAIFFATHSGFIVAAGYCGHDNATHDPSHIGHHDHQHPDDQVPSTPGAVDLDCGLCHLSGAGFLDSMFVLAATSSPFGALPLSTASDHSSSITSLFRPPIPRLA